MNYSISNFKNANKEVRDSAFKLIMNIYRYIGDGVRGYFKDLRPAQVTILEEGFDGLDGLNRPEDNDMDQNNEFMNDSKMIYDHKKDVAKKGKLKEDKKQQHNDQYNNYDQPRNISILF